MRFRILVQSYVFWNSEWLRFRDHEFKAAGM